MTEAVQATRTGILDTTHATHANHIHGSVRGITLPARALRLHGARRDTQSPSCMNGDTDKERSDTKRRHGQTTTQTDGIERWP